MTRAKLMPTGSAKIAPPVADPDEPRITARPPADGTLFAARVPHHSRGESDTHLEQSPGCYLTPRRRGAP